MIENHHFLLLYTNKHAIGQRAPPQRAEAYLKVAELGRKLSERSREGWGDICAQTKVTDSNLERLAAEIQVCCLNAQMSGFMLSRDVA